MPLFIWKKLLLSELTPTRMTLELANRSVAYSVGVAEDVFVKVGKFYFPADFVVVDYDESINRIDVIDVSCEEYAQEVLGFLDSLTSGNPTPSDPIITSSSPSFTPFEGNNFILEEIESFLRTPYEFSTLHDDFDLEGDIAFIENLLNEDPSLNLPPMKNEDLKQADATMTKVKDEEKAALLKVLKSHKRAIAWKISDIKDIDPRFYTHKILTEDDFKLAVQHQRRVNQKIHEMTHLLEKETLFIFSNECIEAFNILKKNLTEASILVAPDWDLPFKIMCDASDYAVGAVLGKCKTKHFQPIHYASKTMTDAQAHYTTTEKELLAMVYAFEKFRRYLVLSKTIVYTNHSDLKYLLAKQDAKSRLLQWILLLQEFDVIIRDKKGAKNLAADHLSILEFFMKMISRKRKLTKLFLSRPLE
nr:reverse transcriptase domain-containing protein [Tanacetum cinerariifolium]